MVVVVVAQAACVALVAGTAVGAGVLAMPAKTVATGLAPSATILLLCWIVSAVRRLCLGGAALLGCVVLTVLLLSLLWW